MQRFASLILVAIIAMSSLGAAQTIWTYDAGAPGIILPTYLPSPCYWTGAPGLTGPGPVLAGAAFPPTPPIQGGIAIDQTTSWVYMTDGFGITIDAHPLYAPLVGPSTPPMGPFVLPLVTGAPVTGIGMDPMTGMLWMTDGGLYWAAMPVPPFTPIAGPVPFPFPVLGQLMSGIDFDQSTGTLWGVDLGGNIYNWFPFGGPAGPVPVSTVFIAGSNLPLTGIAVNECNGPNSVGIPFCSGQIPGYHVVVTEGLFLYDAINLGNPPIPAGFASGIGANGLAFSADQQYVPGAGMSPIPVGLLGWAKPQHNGLGGGNALVLTGAQPNTLALFLYDLCPIPGGLLVPLSGETLWLNPLSPNFAFATLATDPAGNLNAFVDFTPAVPGITFCGQFAIFSPPSPLGYALTDAMQFTSGLQ